MARKAISSYEILRLVENDGIIGVWDWELGGNRLHWTPGFYRLLGIDSTEPPSFETYLDLLHPDDRVNFQDPLGLIADEALSRRVLRLVRRDGSRRWLDSRTEVTLSPDGTPLRLTGIVRDVTEFREVADALDATRRRLITLARLLDLDIWTVWPDGAAVDPIKWRKRPDQTPVQSGGWGRLDAVHPEDREGVGKAWRQAVLRGNQYTARYRMKKADGTYTAVHSRGLPVRSANGVIQWWFGVNTCAELAQQHDEHHADVLTGAQVRAGRALLNWSLADLSTETGLSVSTVRRLDAEGTSFTKNATFQQLIMTFNRHGVSFIADKSGTIGVTLRVVSNN